jgi:hypothetical protein
MNFIVAFLLWWILGLLGVAFYWIKSPGRLKKWGKYNIKFIIFTSLIGGAFVFLFSLLYFNDKNEKI